MISATNEPLEEDVVPQAIFWRPITYFASLYREDADDLDAYAVATFRLGNQMRFDLRHYQRHPKYTVTLYLPTFIATAEEIYACIDYAIEGLAVPHTAVAWHRRMDFEFGKLERRGDDRLREAEARVLALKIAATLPGRAGSTEQIKELVPRFTELSPADLRPSVTRKNEQRWQQIVGNVISHRESKNGPFVKGYARRTADGLEVTRVGMDYLKSIGFVPADS